MSVQLITKTVYKCHCELPHCLHDWESEMVPNQCAACKSFVWNREDKRKRVSVICSSCGTENFIRTSWRKKPVKCSECSNELTQVQGEEK